MDTKWLAIQIPKGLWRAIRTQSLELDKSHPELIIPVLEREFGWKPPLDKTPKATKTKTSDE